MRQWFFLIVCSLLVLMGGCAGTKDTAAKESVKPKVTADKQIDSVDNAVDVILDSATARFIGYHPVDENFLFRISNEYGGKLLCDVASYSDFEDPEIWYATYGKSIHVLWWEYCRATGIADEDAKLVHTAKCAKESETVLDFCGDLTLAAQMATTDYMESKPHGLIDCFSTELLAEMRGADLFVVNNEFVYSKRGEPTPRKTYTFRADPSYVKYLDAIGADLVTLANNHVFDYGSVGLLDTLDTVDSAGIFRIGAGRNLQEAMLPIYFVANGRKIAIVNATQIERSFPFTQEATPTEPGVFKTLDSSLFCSVIKRAKRNADYCIVCVHWGTEYMSHYGSDQYELATDFVKSGADVIVGGHTHCLQGIEYVENVPVYYSLGNYFFSLDGKMPEMYSTGLARIRIRSDGAVNFEFVPCRFTDGNVKLLSAQNQARALFDYIESISETTAISDDGTISRR